MPIPPPRLPPCSLLRGDGSATVELAPVLPGAGSGNGRGVTFATVEVEPSREVGAVAIEVFGVTIRLEGESSAKRIAEVIAELRTLR